MSSKTAKSHITLQTSESPKLTNVTNKIIKQNKSSSKDLAKSQVVQKTCITPNEESDAIESNEDISSEEEPDFVDDDDDQYDKNQIEGDYFVYNFNMLDFMKSFKLAFRLDLIESLIYN